MTKTFARSPLRTQASPGVFRRLIPVLLARGILPSLRRHRATRDERATEQDRVVWRSLHIRRTVSVPAGERTCIRGPAPSRGNLHPRDTETFPPARAGRRRKRRRTSRSSWPGPDSECGGDFLRGAWLVHAEPKTPDRSGEATSLSKLRTTRVEAKPRRCSSPRRGDPLRSLTSLDGRRALPLARAAVGRASPLGIAWTERKEASFRLPVIPPPAGRA